MKRLIVMLTLLSLLFNGNLCFSQNDSIRVETEYQQGNKQYYENKYMYLDINLSDDHRLLKIGIQPFKPNDKFEMAVFIIHGGFEQKLNSSLSFVNEINAIMLWSGTDAFHQLGYSVGGRYYFTKKGEIAKGKSGDNCNGVYLLFKMSDLLSFYTLRDSDSGSDPSASADELYRGAEFSLKPEIGLGIQQKIRHHLYFDANISCNYDLLRGDFGFGITFLFGGLLSFMN